MRRNRRAVPFADALGTLVGGPLIARLTDRASAPLTIGRQTWTIHELATQIGVVNTRAARLLSEAAASINARSVRDLYRRSSPYTFAGIGGLGETTMYVLWRVFETEGLDPDAWATAGKRKDALVSFRSLKIREQKAEQRTRDGAKKSAAA